MEDDKKRRAERLARTLRDYNTVKEVLLEIPPSGAAKMAHIYARLTINLFLK